MSLAVLCIMRNALPQVCKMEPDKGGKNGSLKSHWIVGSFSATGHHDGCRDARPILWCSSVSLQLDILTLLQSVCGHTGDASMSAANSYKWVSETWGGTWRFGLCQDGFWKQVREMLSCLLASWLFLGYDTARMLVEESILNYIVYSKFWMYIPF